LIDDIKQKQGVGNKSKVVGCPAGVLCFGTDDAKAFLQHSSTAAQQLCGEQIALIGDSSERPAVLSPATNPKHPGRHIPFRFSVPSGTRFLFRDVVVSVREKTICRTILY
jgi:hypothetical protein